MNRLIYVSRARQALPLDIKDILASSRANNEALGITGALCFLSGVYLQCLEGEKGALLSLYARIARDPRHRDPKLLANEPAAMPMFRDWSMAHMMWNGLSEGIFAFFGASSPDDLYEIASGKATLLLKSLSESAQWEAL